MIESLQSIKRVPSELLQERLEMVKQLADDGLERYEVSKDKLTGEHYLHYAYMHKQVAALGPESNGEETFHQLMPLENDDVLAIVLGEQDYSYPQCWTQAFLRNGPDGDYVWFDPAYTDQEEDNEQIGRKLREQLLQFKQSSELTEEGVRKLLLELDRTRDGLDK
ncbi:hypothetical protein [Paenibacillus agricola]|uniref:SMI1/KNR4 family protein n=1 Tax=Paenibacillus agricola TaxID=2716264 RepID=A0ABX0J5L2_9BACL|nr:hypothetical protein [Paenibacillus agricola]NHN30691.1 hypothetical protein [Paenibacillus agricola]